MPYSITSQLADIRAHLTQHEHIFADYSRRCDTLIQAAQTDPDRNAFTSAWNTLCQQFNTEAQHYLTHLIAAFARLKQAIEQSWESIPNSEKQISVELFSEFSTLETRIKTHPCYSTDANTMWMTLHSKKTSYITPNETPTVCHHHSDTTDTETLEEEEHKHDVFIQRCQTVRTRGEQLQLDFLAGKDPTKQLNRWVDHVAQLQQQALFPAWRLNHSKPLQVIKQQLIKLNKLRQPLIECIERLKLWLTDHFVNGDDILDYQLNLIQLIDVVKQLAQLNSDAMFHALLQKHFPESFQYLQLKTEDPESHEIIAALQRCLDQLNASHEKNKQQEQQQCDDFQTELPSLTYAIHSDITFENTDSVFCNHGAFFSASETPSLQQELAAVGALQRILPETTENFYGIKLCIAALTDDTALFNDLLTKKANIQYTLPNGETPLSLAAAFGHRHIALILLCNGASIYNEYGILPHKLTDKTYKKNLPKQLTALLRYAENIAEESFLQGKIALLLNNLADELSPSCMVNAKLRAKQRTLSQEIYRWAYAIADMSATPQQVYDYLQPRYIRLSSSEPVLSQTFDFILKHLLAPPMAQEKKLCLQQLDI